MTVRLAYITRESRGGVLRGVRLVGQNADERWSGAGGSAGHEGAIELAAGWIAEKLSQTRSAGRLEMLCLDADGGVCSWVSTPRAELAGTVARMGSTSGMAAGMPGEGGEGGSTTPLTYFAGEDIDSTIQPLVSVGEDDDEGAGGAIVKAKASSKHGSGGKSAERVAVLAMGDVPARVLMDSLDRLGVEVQSVASVWHVIARVWDPESPLAPGRAGVARDGVAESSPTVASVVVDPGEGRLIWSWSQGGELVAGGSMRLRMHGTEEVPRVVYGADEVARLVSEWMSWSVQVGRCPRRVVCVVPGEGADEQAAGFGQALGAAWTEATVDLAVHADPMGVTLTRLATALEGTPIPKDRSPDAGASLVGLTDRPGKAHRLFYWWIALFVIAASALTGVVAWQFRQKAVELREAAAAWNAKWSAELKEAFPSAIGRVEGPKLALEDEIARIQKEIVPAQNKDPAKPVLEELQTISMVLQHPDYTLGSIDLNSSTETVALRVQAKTYKAAEDLARALRSISGSHVESWEWDRQSGGAPAAAGADGAAPLWYSYRGRFAKAAGGGS